MERTLQGLGYDVAAGSLAHLPTGRTNYNFTAWINGEAVVLRIWKSSTRDHAVAELTVLRRLASEGIRCPRPLPDPAGQLLDIDGQPAALFEFIPGAAYAQADRRAHADMCTEVSRLLAQVHVSARDLDRLTFRERGYAERLDAYEEAARGVDLGALHTKCEASIARIRLLAEEVHGISVDESLSHGLVHGDPGDWNVLVQDGKPWLLDFDMCHRDLLAYDVGHLLSQWAAFAGGGGWDYGLARLMVNSYSQIRPISSKERRAIALSAPLRQAIDTLAGVPYFAGPNAPQPLDRLLSYLDPAFALADDDKWVTAITTP